VLLCSLGNWSGSVSGVPALFSTRHAKTWEKIGPEQRRYVINDIQM